MRTKDCNKEGSEGKRTDGPFFILELDEGTWKSPWTSHRKVGSQSPGDTNNTTYMVCLSGRDKLSSLFPSCEDLPQYQGIPQFCQWEKLCRGTMPHSHTIYFRFWWCFFPSLFSKLASSIAVPSGASNYYVKMPQTDKVAKQRYCLDQPCLLAVFQQCNTEKKAIL